MRTVIFYGHIFRVRGNEPFAFFILIFFFFY